MANARILLTHAALDDMASKPFDLGWITKYNVDRSALKKAEPGKDHLSQMIRYKKAVHLGDWLQFNLEGQQWTVAVVEAKMTSRQFSVVAFAPPGVFAYGCTGFQEMTQKLLIARNPQADSEAITGRRLLYRDINLLRNGQVVDNLGFIRSEAEFWEKVTQKHKTRPRPRDNNGILTFPPCHSFSDP